MRKLSRKRTEHADNLQAEQMQKRIIINYHWYGIWFQEKRSSSSKLNRANAKLYHFRIKNTMKLRKRKYGVGLPSIAVTIETKQSSSVKRRCYILYWIVHLYLIEFKEILPILGNKTNLNGEELWYRKSDS